MEDIHYVEGIKAYKLPNINISYPQVCHKSCPD